MKNAIGISILIIQLLFIATSRLGDTKYYCWAPHDDQNIYTISVIIDNKTLTREETNERYKLDYTYYWTGEKLKWMNIESRYMGNVIDKVRQYESTYGKHEGAKVKITYRKNGGNAQHWTWPEAEK